MQKKAKQPTSGGLSRLDDETKDMLQKTPQMERTYYGRLMKFFELDERELEIADKSGMPERLARDHGMIAHYGQMQSIYASHEGRSYQDVHAFLSARLGRKWGASAYPVDPTTKSARSLRRLLT